MLELADVSELVAVPVGDYVGNDYLGSRETAFVVALIASVRPRVVIEFGVNRGRTARAILDALQSPLERYIGIDIPFGHPPRLKCQESEVPVNAGYYAASDVRFELCRQDSMELTPADLEPIDAAFIDGDHSEKAVAHDSALARVLLRPGGIIVWHDYMNTAVGVTPVLDRLAASGWPIKRIEGTWLAFMRLD